MRGNPNFQHLGWGVLRGEWKIPVLGRGEPDPDAHCTVLGMQSLMQNSSSLLESTLLLGSTLLPFTIDKSMLLSKKKRRKTVSQHF